MASSIPLLPTVNLPLPILIHSLGLCLAGLIDTFFTNAPPSAKRPNNGPKTVGTPVGERPSPLIGVATMGLGLSYIFTSYMPIEENQFLYASVPVRIFLGLVMAARVLIDRFTPAGKPRLNPKDVRSLVGLGLYDVVGALFLGWTLGNYSGRLPGW